MVMSVSQEKFGCRLDDGVGIQPVGAIKIGKVAGLAEAIGAERAHPHAPDPAKPRQCARRSVEHGHKARAGAQRRQQRVGMRSEEHTSALQSLMRISYAVFCLKKNTKHIRTKQSKLSLTKIHSISKD